MRFKIPKLHSTSWHPLCCRANINTIKIRHPKLMAISMIKVTVRQGRKTWRARVEACRRVARRHSLLGGGSRFGFSPRKNKNPREGWTAGRPVAQVNVLVASAGFQKKKNVFGQEISPLGKNPRAQRLVIFNLKGAKAGMHWYHERKQILGTRATNKQIPLYILLHCSTMTGVLFFLRLGPEIGQRSSKPYINSLSATQPSRRWTDAQKISAQ